MLLCFDQIPSALRELSLRGRRKHFSSIFFPFIFFFSFFSPYGSCIKLLRGLAGSEQPEGDGLVSMGQVSSSEMHEKLQNYVINTSLSQVYLKKPSLLSLSHEGEQLHQKHAGGFSKLGVRGGDIWSENIW